jgi:hypothetical protein
MGGGKMRKIVIVLILILTILIGCKKEKMERAKEMMKQGALEEVRTCVLFDNSLSYKPYISDTLIQVRDLFRYLAEKYPESNTTLIMIDKEAKIIWSGASKDLQRAYDELKETLRHGTSRFTNLTDAVNKALYFLNKEKAGRKILLIFSDMKHSMPNYYPKDQKVVPPPENFPWERLKDVEIYVFYVPYEEWQEWQKVIANKEVKIKSFHPEELKTLKAFQVVFGEE